jgi:hypothetical protein
VPLENYKSGQTKNPVCRVTNRALIV